MKHPKVHRLQWYAVALATLFVVALLAWEYTHGGVLSYHFLDRRDLPAISNWWGLVIIPMWGWIASWFVLRRSSVEPKALPKAFAGAFGALIVGIILSISFITGHEQITSYIFYAALLSGILLPTYRAEYAFGFVIGMAFAVGTVLPTIGALIGITISAIFHFLIRPAFTWTVRRIRA